MPEKRQKMLFLDTRPERMEAARGLFREYDITFVEDVKGCLGQLSVEDFDEVHLENDLVRDFMDPISIHSGMQVVRYIARCGWPEGKPKPLFIVHSRNLFASYLMVRHLQALGLFAFYRPFYFTEEVPCAL